MSASSKIIQAAAGNAAGEGLYVEEIFSTYLYTGTGFGQTINNGIDLSGEGGLVWIKNRDATDPHMLVDTARGASDGSSARTLQTNSGSSAFVYNDVTAFNNNGFTTGGTDQVATNNEDFVSWTFRKAPKFFDVVTYTGDGLEDRTVSHNLGSVPGCIITKRTDFGSDWTVVSRNSSGNYVGGAYPDNFGLNNTQLASTTLSASDREMTATTFNPSKLAGDVGSFDVTRGNENGGTYVAYLFAHNDGDGDFGETGDQDIIKCGSVTTGNVSTDVDVDLGFEPQWILMKNSGAVSQWFLVDVMRGWISPTGTTNQAQPLFANLTNTESTGTNFVKPTSTGFTVVGDNLGDTQDWIYIAIRRGPMKTPESGTEVFAPVAYTGTGTTGQSLITGFPVDMFITADRTSSANLRGYAFPVFTRILSLENAFSTSKTDSWGGGWGTAYWRDDSNTSLIIPDGSLPSLYSNQSGVDFVNYHFRRAPGFFDVVAYTGNGTAGRTVSHNLGAVPELMIVKNRDTAYAWKVYHSTPGETKYAKLSDADAFGTATAYWNDTAPTDSVFTVGTGVDVNASGDSIIAYLFATVPGVSKVFSVTKSSGSDATVDCGFSAGARFVLLKRTDASGDWFVFDTERGIVAGNDPRLSLNTSAAEETGNDYIDPNSSGFTIVDNGLDDGDYIGLAIA